MKILSVVRTRPLGWWLGLLAILLLAPGTSLAQWRVLFYEHAYSDGSVPHDITQTVAYQFVNSDSRFVDASLTASSTASQVWRPGHSNAALDWNRKSKADFEAFHLIVICDPGLGSVDSDLFTGALVNRTLWSSAVGTQNNVLVMMGDPQYHSALGGAQSYIEQGLVFAAQNAAAGPGLFVTSGATGAGPLDFSRHVINHLLDWFGTFDVDHGSGQEVSLLGTIPALACLTEVAESGLSGWGSSAHDGFHSWPSGFLPVAMVTDAQQHTFTPAASLAPIPARGLVHVVARGLSHRLWGEPLRQCILQGTQASVIDPRPIG